MTPPRSPEMTSQGVSARWAALSERARVRVVGLALGLPAASVIGVARWLTPSPDGYGTHRQLGLAGCTMLTLTGWPCPMCGMTTTFSLLAHLRWLDAFMNQPFGPVLFLGTMLVAVGGLLDAITGRDLLGWGKEKILRHEGRVAMFLFTGLFLGWAYKAVRMHPEVFGL